MLFYFFWKLQISLFFVEVIRVKHGCQKSFDRFPDPPGEKSHAELCGRIQLLGCRKRSKELHGLNLAPIEPQVFIKNSFACEGFDGTRMAVLDALGDLLCCMPWPCDKCLLQFPFICLPDGPR